MIPAKNWWHEFKHIWYDSQLFYRIIGSAKDLLENPGALARCSTGNSDHNVFVIASLQMKSTNELLLSTGKTGNE